MKSTVFDLEANGLSNANKVWVISTSEKNKNGINSYSDDDNNLKSIEEGVEDLNSSDELVGHNIIGYDLPLLEKLYGWIPQKNVNIIDTLVLSRLGNPDRGKPPGYTGKGGPHSLECWGYRVCRAKPDHEDWTVYSSPMLERNREDVAINKLTGDCLSGEFAGHDWSEAIDIENNVLRIITEQQENGVQFDVERATELVEQLTRDIDLIEAELHVGLPISYIRKGVSINKPFLQNGRYAKSVLDWFLTDTSDKLSGDISIPVGGPFTRIVEKRIDLGSIKQVKDYLLTQGWKPTQWNYKDGEKTSPKLTEDSFDTIEGDFGILIKKRTLMSHRRAQIQGWLDRVREDGRLEAGANTCGTPTGRFTHWNVVNVPKAHEKVYLGKEMRGLFIPRPGYKMVGYDAKGLELRMLAHYMNDKDFIYEVLHGDPHISNQKSAGLTTRDDAKTFIYAFIYGAGDGKIGSIVGGGKSEGSQLRKKFLSNLPKLDKLIRKVIRAASKGWIKGLDGRKLWIRKNANGELQKNKALNVLLQSAGAICMKKSMIFLDELVKLNKLDAIKVLDMHDEAQWEVHPKDVEKFTELVHESFVKVTKYFKLNIPLEADVLVGNNWSETH